jgi:hypothetical protein
MNIETSIATNIESSAPMSIGTKIGHRNESSIEAKIETARVETRIDIVMTTRMHPPDAMMDFLRQPGTGTTRVVGMVESISGWCSNGGKRISHLARTQRTRSNGDATYSARYCRRCSAHA